MCEPPRSHEQMPPRSKTLSASTRWSKLWITCDNFMTKEAKRPGNRAARCWSKKNSISLQWQLLALQRSQKLWQRNQVNHHTQKLSLFAAFGVTRLNAKPTKPIAFIICLHLGTSPNKKSLHSMWKILLHIARAAGLHQPM